MHAQYLQFQLVSKSFVIGEHGPGHQPLKLVCTKFEISHLQLVEYINYSMNSLLTKLK